MVAGNRLSKIRLTKKKCQEVVNNCQYDLDEDSHYRIETD